MTEQSAKFEAEPVIKGSAEIDGTQETNGNAAPVPDTIGGNNDAPEATAVTRTVETGNFAVKAVNPAVDEERRSRYAAKLNELDLTEYDVVEHPFYAQNKLIGFLYVVAAVCLGPIIVASFMVGAISELSKDYQWLISILSSAVAIASSFVNDPIDEVSAAINIGNIVLVGLTKLKLEKTLQKDIGQFTWKLAAMCNCGAGEDIELSNLQVGAFDWFWYQKKALRTRVDLTRSFEARRSLREKLGTYYEEFLSLRYSNSTATSRSVKAIVVDIQSLESYVKRFDPRFDTVDDLYNFEAGNGCSVAIYIGSRYHMADLVRVVLPVQGDSGGTALMTV